MPLPPTDKKKVNIRLFQGDTERLAAFYPHVPYNLVIRQLVKAHLDTLEAKLAQRGLTAPPIEEKKHD